MKLIEKPQFEVPSEINHNAVQVNIIKTERTWRMPTDGDRKFKSGDHMLILEIRPLEVSLLTYKGDVVIIKVSDVSSGDIEIVELEVK